MRLCNFYFFVFFYRLIVYKYCGRGGKKDVVGWVCKVFGIVNKIFFSLIFGFIIKVIFINYFVICWIVCVLWDVNFIDL